MPKAEGYEWRQVTREAGKVFEGAESGLSGFTAQTSDGYDVLVPSPVASGGFSFHLAHPAPQKPQALEYEKEFLAGATSELRFKSCLGWATGSQTASVQVSLSGGESWAEVYGQAGTDSARELGFDSRSVGLGSYAGSSVLFRFVYDYSGTGRYYTDTTGWVGWHFDDIEFRDLEALGDVGAPTLAAGNSFAFEPATAGAYLLQAQALVFGGTRWIGGRRLR